MPQIAPSILSADFGQLAAQVAAAERGGAELIHIDVMDGHFVPNITMGPLVVAAVRRATRLALDCHLMIEEPDRYLETFVRAGADLLSVHWEAVPHVHRTVQRIRELGARAGVVVNPGTPVAVLEDVLPDLDYVLVMSVNPGFGGQKFLELALDKVRRVRRMIAERGLATKVEIDGGVGEENARALVEAGVDILVAGSSVFGNNDGAVDPAERTRRLLARARGERPA